MKKIFAIVVIMSLALITEAQDWTKVKGLAAQLAAKVSLTDTEPLTNNVFLKSFFEATALTDAATITWNGTASKFATVTLAGNRTLSITNPIAGIEYVLRIAQDGTGGRLLTWPANTIWPGGTAPTLTSIALGIDVVRLQYDGSNFLGKADINLTSDLKNGLVSYYTFDGATGTADSKGTNTATLSGGLLVNQTGKLGQCIAFDAVDDYASLNSNTLYDFTAAYSISFWVKTPAMLNSTVLSKLGASLVAYTIKLGGSSIRLYTEGAYFTPGIVDIGAGAVFSANTWTHWVFTFNGSSLKQYKNGALINTTSVSGTIVYGTSSLFLGRASAGGSYFNGSLDELALFGREITATEVARIYNTGSGLAYTSW